MDNKIETIVGRHFVIIDANDFALSVRKAVTLKRIESVTPLTCSF